MRYLIRCVFLVILIAGGLSAAASADDDTPVDLGSISVSRGGSPGVHSYTASRRSFCDSPYSPFVGALESQPLDLETRSPQGGVQTDYSLEGSSFQGVLMLLDGQRINDPQTAHHNSDIPVTSEDVEKIEVIPGITSARLGPDGIGGAIDTVLRKPDADRNVIEAGIGERGSRNGLLSVARKGKDIGWQGSLEESRSDGFRADTDFNQWLATFHAVCAVPDGELGSYFGSETKEFGAFDFYTPGLGYPSREWTRTYLSTTGLSVEKEGFLLKPNFLWRRHYDKFVLDETGLRSGYLAYHHTDMFTPNIYVQAEAGSLGKAGIGAEYGDERMISTSLGKHGRAHRSLFADDEKTLNDRLSLAFSGRWDDYDGFGSVYTGSSGFTWKLCPDNFLHAGVSESARVPSFTELYYNDPTTLGDNTLAEERSLNYQAGYDHKNKTLSWGQTLFVRREKDFIDWVKPSDGPLTKWRAENIVSADVYGLTNYAGYTLNDNISTSINYTYTDRRAGDQGLLFKYGPNYAEHLLNDVWTIRLPFGVQTAGLTYKKKPGRGGFCVFNLKFGCDLTKDAGVYLKLSNLFDKKYEEIAGIPQPGRWIEGGIRVAW